MDVTRRTRLVLSSLVAVAIGLIVLAAVSGDDADGRCPGQPAAVELVTPNCNSSVLQQQRIEADLAPGYEGTLAINGVAIPDDELIVIDALNLLWYELGPGKTIERLDPQINQVTVTYWRSADGPAQSNRWTWVFRAA